MSRYVKIPEDVKFPSKADGKDDTWSFFKFFDEVLLGDVRFKAPTKNVRIAMKIGDAIEKAQTNGRVVELQDAHWELLNQAVQEPRFEVWSASGPHVHEGFATIGTKGVMRFMPFIDAIEKAEEK